MGRHLSKPQRRKEMEKEEEEKERGLSLTPHNFTKICPLSHPTQPHTLSIEFNQNTTSNCISCGKRKYSYTDWGGLHYHCTICDVDFHFFCIDLPRKINHPFHLQHPLTFTRGNHERIVDDGNIMVQGTPSKAVIINSDFSTLDHGKSTWGSIYDNCSWCRKPIPWRSSNKLDQIFYRCLICGFCLDAACAKRNPPVTIENPRSHHHPLSFFPRPLLVPCDACGLVNESEPSYACFQCNYMVHQSCVALPRVIKITRHPHRLSHSPYFSTLNSLCRVCYKTVDIKYGQFSCKDEDCSYVLHPKCATLEHVWDGKELEWVEEEHGVIEDVAPFEKVGDDLIKHFCHRHNLKLQKYDNVRDMKKKCQACVLPIDLRDFYNCTECDFFLHKVCASLPRKADHALHKHSLVLEPSPPYRYEFMRLDRRFPSDDYDFMSCSACSRASTGFRYKCSENSCYTNFGFKIDVRCFLLPDYFTDKCHEHPLFMSPYNHRYSKDVTCNGCKKICSAFCLQCSLCDFTICYRCATIPKELHYKYDEHPLTLCHGERSTDGKYWCEECEKEVNPIEWFYTCDKCCITIHHKCVFGSNVYMNTGYEFEYMFDVVKVVINNSSRPICNNCGDRCPDSSYYIAELNIYCSLYCLKHIQSYREKLRQ